ncbi:MAG: hypothetical protein HQ581_26530 [Planctomycetes bacterium]|nr:hypothetical protein [Planctomycetota bacterium]
MISGLLNDPDSTEATTFAKDVADVLALTEEDRQACLDMLPSVHFSQDEAEALRLLDRLVDDRHVDRDKLASAIEVMEFLLSMFLSEDIPDSDWKLWASDLEETGHLTSSTRPVFEAMVANIRSELATKVEPETRRRTVAAGVLPLIESCGITVEVRSVSEDSYRPGTPIEQFEPRVTETVTVASINITLDEGPFKDVYFQASESVLDNLIRAFQAAKKEMAALRGFLKLED